MRGSFVLYLFLCALHFFVAANHLTRRRWLRPPSTTITFIPTTSFSASVCSILFFQYHFILFYWKLLCYRCWPGCADGLQSGDPDPDGSEQATAPVAGGIFVLIHTYWFIVVFLYVILYVLYHVMISWLIYFCIFVVCPLRLALLFFIVSLIVYLFIFFSFFFAAHAPPVAGDIFVLVHIYWFIVVFFSMFFLYFIYHVMIFWLNYLFLWINYLSSAPCVLRSFSLLFN